MIVQRCGIGLAFCLGGLGIFVGCNSTDQTAQPLNPSAFVARRPVLGPNADGPVDRPGALNYDTVHADPAQRPVASGDPGHISRTVREEVQPPGGAIGIGPAPAAEPAAPPATQPEFVPGQYQIVGSVLAEVNGSPIYADKVLAVLDRALQAESRKYDAKKFRDVAADLIQKQVWEFVHAELEFAAAQRSLEPKDEELAKSATMAWRKEQITKAGGSVELARRKAADDGTDFDDLARQEFRLNMTRLYYQKRVFPQIQVSASDIRDYYRDNVSKEFTELAAARFRVIEIDADKTGGRKEALDKITHLRDRAVNGEDFATLASKVNDDPYLLRSGGEIGWMERGAYKIDKVEKAVWNLEPGGLTDVIADGDSFYIAKLEERKLGKVRPFEDEAVQDSIRETLRKRQFNILRDKVRAELEKRAIIRPNPQMLDIALNMALQKYRGT